MTNDNRDDTTEPFPLPPLQVPDRRPLDNYVREDVVHDACDLMAVLLVAAGGALADVWKVRAAGFIRRYGRRELQQILDDTRP